MTRQLMQEYYLKLFEETHASHVFVTSEIIEVDLPRPREWSMVTSKRYLEIKAEALELLHEEAVKASTTSGKVDVDLSGLLEPVNTD